jgi:hypothetical protein
MRVFKTKWFVRFARKERIEDAALSEAVKRAEAGLIDADLSGGVIKQRVARQGQGKSGGFRTLIAYRAGKLAIFVYGFDKNDRENITDGELETLQEIAAAWFAGTAADWARQVEAGLAKEVEYGKPSKDP